MRDYTHIHTQRETAWVRADRREKASKLFFLRNLNSDWPMHILTSVNLYIMLCVCVGEDLGFLILHAYFEVPQNHFK